jgi:hypothetical protein
MGFFWQGLPPYLIDWSRSFLPEPFTSVETGTFQGDTSELLARSFGTCTTIERSETLAAAAKERFATDSRVTVLQGSSRDVLEAALPAADVSAFFWLDAHGFYDYEGPDDQENPLLDELDLIIRCRGKSANVIVVDDARGMGVQPEWPPLADVLDRLKGAGFDAAIIDDTLIAVSASLKPDFYGLYQKSRIVEVSAVFHIWPGVMKASRRRARTDSIVEKFGRFRRR